MLHRIGEQRDVERIALKIDKMKRLGFKPSMRSGEAVKTTAKTS